MSLKIRPLSLTKPELARLTEAREKVSAYQSRLDAVGDGLRLRKHFTTAAQRYSDGTATLEEAALFAAMPVDAATSAAQALRRVVKDSIKGTIGTVADLIRKAESHHISELRRVAATLEERERADAIQLGECAEDFTPSNVLVAARRRHADAHAAAQARRETHYNLADFGALVDSVGDAEQGKVTTKGKDSGDDLTGAILADIEKI
jgi:hypothetical protein